MRVERHFAAVVMHGEIGVMISFMRDSSDNIDERHRLVIVREAKRLDDLAALKCPFRQDAQLRFNSRCGERMLVMLWRCV